MHRMQGLPALFFGLETYQVLYNDPLHYIFHYTQNLYNELPKHCKKSSNKFIYASFIRKYAKNSSNYRESLLRVCT